MAIIHSLFVIHTVLYVRKILHIIILYCTRVGCPIEQNVGFIFHPDSEKSDDRFETKILTKIYSRRTTFASFFVNRDGYCDSTLRGMHTRQAKQ